MWDGELAALVSNCRWDRTYRRPVLEAPALNCYARNWSPLAVQNDSTYLAGLLRAQIESAHKCQQE